MSVNHRTSVLSQDFSVNCTRKTSPCTHPTSFTQPLSPYLLSWKHNRLQALNNLVYCTLGKNAVPSFPVMVT